MHAMGQTAWTAMRSNCIITADISHCRHDGVGGAGANTCCCCCLYCAAANACKPPGGTGILSAGPCMACSAGHHGWLQPMQPPLSHQLMKTRIIEWLVLSTWIGVGLRVRGWQEGGRRAGCAGACTTKAAAARSSSGAGRPAQCATTIGLCEAELRKYTTVLHAELHALLKQRGMPNALHQCTPPPACIDAPCRHPLARMHNPSCCPGPNCDSH